MIRHCWKIFFEIVGVLLAGTAILLGLLAWRLSAGPIEVDFLTPYLESAMADGAVRLSLGGTSLRWDSFDRPLAFVAVDLQLKGRDGGTIATVPQVELALSVPRLLRGSVTPERLVLVRPKLHVIRTVTGEFVFSIGDQDQGVDGSSNDIDVVRSLLASLRAPAGSVDVPMAALRQLEVIGAEVDINDRVLGTVWSLPRADITLGRVDGAIRGGMLLDLQLGDRLAALTANLNFALDTGVTILDLGLANVVPADLAGFDPLLTPLAMVAMPVFGTVSAELGPDLTPYRLAFALQGSAGHLRLGDLYNPPPTVAGATLSGLLDVDNERLVIDRFSVDLGGPALNGSATIADNGGIVDMEVVGAIERLPVDLLATYWPKDLTPTPREWVTKNLSLGMVRDANLTFRAQFPRERPEEIDVAEVGGTINFDGIRVNYLDGLPAVEDVSGQAVYDATSFTLSLDGGHLRDLSMTGANIAITGFDKPVNHIDIELVLSGPARTTLEVLDSPRLGYISQLGLETEAVSGTMAGRVRFTFPLVKDVGFDQVAVAAAANLIDVSVVNAALGPISGIDGTLKLDGRGMTITGDATVSEVPLSFDWTENFGDGEGFNTRLAASATLDRADVDRLGLDIYESWSGAVGTRVIYTDLDGRNATLRADLDLIGAIVRLDEIGWEKPIGEPGSWTLDIVLNEGRIAAIPSFAVDGNGLTVQGSASFGLDGDGVERILLSEFRFGETDLTAELTRIPDGGYAVNARGPRMDARPLLAHVLSPADEDLAGADGGSDGAADAEPSVASPTEDDSTVTPLQVTVAFEEVIAGEGGSLYGVSGIAARDRIGWNEFDLIARTDTGGQVQSRYEPLRPVGHQFSLTAEDAGAALRALDFSESISGGRLSVTGVQSERGGALEGSVDLRDYRAVNMPALGQLLAALSLGGLQNVLSTEGLTFQRLTGEYAYADDVLSLRNTRTAGGALGLTMNGEFDGDTGQLNMEGAIVPIYGVNQLIGSIPILGNLLTGGEGQGIFAFAYSLEGPIKEPQVTVNPLSVLAPGFLRSLFFQDSTLGQPEVEPQERRQRLNDDD